MQIPGLPLASGTAKLTHYRIDEEHSNAFVAWQVMGEPPQPTPAQYARLEKAGQLAQLAAAPAAVNIENGAVMLPVNLPRQAVSLLVLEW